MYRIILSFLLLLLVTVSAAQELSRKGRFFILPETSLWFGAGTRIELAPQIGYHLSDRISVGTGPHYAFIKYKDYFYGDGFSTHMYGLKTFGRISVIRNAEEIFPVYLFSELFFHAEYERLNLERKYYDPPIYPDEGRLWANSVFFGPGINQRIGEFSSYSIMVLWNLNSSFYSIYGNPVYRVGLNMYF